VFLVCCVGNGLFDKLITQSEDSYQVYVCVCVSLCRNLKIGGLHPNWFVVQQQQQ
jgi:hypothetical protein